MFSREKISESKANQIARPPKNDATHIDENLIFATTVNPILSFYRVQNQIGSDIMFATRCFKGQVQTSHLSNFKTRVTSIL